MAAGVAAELRAVAVMGVDAADFFGVWAKLGDTKNIADKNAASAGLRMMFLSVMPSSSEFDAQADLAFAAGQEF